MCVHVCMCMRRQREKKCTHTIVGLGHQLLYQSGKTAEEQVFIAESNNKSSVDTWSKLIIVLMCFCGKVFFFLGH